MIGVTLVTFVLARVIPSNVAKIWAGAQGFRLTEEAEEQVVEEYHLNDPLALQYLYYFGGIVQGDWGVSPVSNQPVSREVRNRLPNTLELTGVAMAISLVFGIPIGVLSAVRANTLWDHISRIVALLGVSMPVFWLGVLLQLVFYYHLDWVPDPGGRLSEAIRYSHPVDDVTGFLMLDTLISGNFVAFKDALLHLCLPALTLGLRQMAMVSRMTRSSMLDVLSEDYMVTARAKGLREWVVIVRHGFPNALMPVTTVVGLSFAWLLTGNVVVEVVFNWPGLGRYGVNAILTYDFPAVMAFTIITSSVFVLVNLGTDLLYYAEDPRVRARALK
jgi:peptide/nickel transport system permease protein